MDLPQGAVCVVGDKKIKVNQAIRKGERFALTHIPNGAHVIQYGWPFGIAQGIQSGDLIHTGNVRELESDLSAPVIVAPPVMPNQEPWISRTFAGFLRSDGRVGVRNHYVIVPTSQCASHVALQVAAQANARLRPELHFPNVDSIVALTNTEGCGCASNMQIDRFLRVLRNHLHHPNVGAALIIDLGCEQTNYQALHDNLRVHGPMPGIPMDWLTIQKEGGVTNTINKALAILEQRLAIVNAAVRTDHPVRHLLIGTECGASDSFSGITANPVIGSAVDKIIAAGGGAILSEVPEMLGAERALMSRMRNENVVADFRNMMTWYRELASRLGVDMTDNLVPENKAGGLINACIKSLGAITKGGTTTIEGIVDYGERPLKPGLHLSQGPGNDLESVTGLAASGATMICFSTGKGTITGQAIVPVIKITSTSSLFRAMPFDMDYDAGILLENPAWNLERMGNALFERILAIASGQKTSAELNGQQQFQIWTAGKLSL
ncbi:MAG: UxaA family hydrolase [Magnetococcus sp. YQC-5]